MSEVPETPVQANCDNPNVLDEIADSSTLTIVVADENVSQKDENIDRKGKRKRSDSGKEAVKEFRPLAPLSSANENLITNLPKPKKAKRGRPPSAKKCSSSVKKQRRARNKGWSDSDSQLSDHDMYKGTIRIIPSSKRESTKRKAAAKVKYTFDTDDESDLSPYWNFADKKPDNERIQKELSYEEVTQESIEFVNETVDDISDSSLINPKDNHPDPSTTLCEPTSLHDADYTLSLRNVEDKVLETTKTPPFPTVSDTSSNSSTSLFIDLERPTTPEISNVRMQENKASSSKNLAHGELGTCKVEKNVDPRLKRSKIVETNILRERNTPPSNHDMKALLYRDDNDSDDLKCSVDSVSPIASPVYPDNEFNSSV